MEESPVVHPSEKTLSFYGLGKLDDHQAEAVNRHLKDCAACQGKSGKSGVRGNPVSVVYAALRHPE